MIYKEIIDKLEILQPKMYGVNYEVSLHVDIFKDCVDLDIILGKIENLYPEAEVDEESLLLTNYDDFVETVTSCFDYRGDSSAGLILTTKEEVALKSEVQEFWIAFNGQIDKDNADFYVYPNDVGLSIDSVFWDYEFLIIDRKNNASLLFYGASSD